MFNPYAWVLVAWTAVLGPVLGNRAGADGVVSPLSVAGVVVGTGVLATGTAVMVAYGLYATRGRTIASADAFGVVPLPRRKPANAANTPAQPAAPAEAAPTEAPPVELPPAEVPPAESAPPAATDSAPTPQDAPAVEAPPAEAAPAPTGP